MATNDTLIGLAVIGGILAAVCGYVAHVSVDVETYPDFETTAGVTLSAPTGTMHQKEYSRAGDSLVPTISTPHRYPNISGNNLTAVIHHGMDALRKRAPQDSKWIECPPANVMW